MSILTDDNGYVHEWVTVVGIVLGFVLLIVLILFGISRIEKYQCNVLQTTANIDTRYLTFGGGCYVKVNGRFIPKENWRGEYEQ